MNDLNQIMLEGRLVRDPQARRLESGAVVCTFTIASNTGYYDKTSNKQIAMTAYMIIEAWRNLGEQCAKYLKKGDGVRVAGKIKQSRWIKDNIKNERTFISAEHVEFLTKPYKPGDPTHIKATEEPDVKEQEEINEEIKQEEPAE